MDPTEKTDLWTPVSGLRLWTSLRGLRPGAHCGGLCLWAPLRGFPAVEWNLILDVCSFSVIAYGDDCTMAGWKGSQILPRMNHWRNWQTMSSMSPLLSLYAPSHYLLIAPSTSVSSVSSAYYTHSREHSSTRVLRIAPCGLRGRK